MALGLKERAKVREILVVAIEKISELVLKSDSERLMFLNVDWLDL
jgi:hypothetical protein